MKFAVLFVALLSAASAFAGTPPLPEPDVLSLLGIGAVAVIIALRNRKK
jgi:hypothetical protein